jgi:uncharacterized protein YqeY
MIRTQITDQMKDAMRSHDKVKLDTLRFVLSQIKYVEIDKHRELEDAEIIDVLVSEVKKRREAITLFKNSGRDQMVTEEEAKLAVITSLLPSQLSEDEVNELIDTAIAKVGKNMGLVMKELSSQIKGRADGKLVSELVRARIA